MPFLGISASIASIATVIFYLQPLKTMTLPAYLQFLQNPVFTPVGSYLDFAVLLGFVVFSEVGMLLNKKKSILSIITLTICSFGFLLSVYMILKPNSGVGTILPPLRQSWFAAVEILKNPIQALFGVGVDNFGSIFTQVKDATYNQSLTYWQINTFAVSRSSLLHVFTEAGVFGLVSLALLLIGVGLRLKTTLKNDLFLPSIFLFIVMLALPPSFFVFFLFFVLLSVFMSGDREHSGAKTVMNLSDMVPIYLGLVTIIFLVVIALTYFLGRAYMAEYMFKKSLDGLAKNDVQSLYENQRQATILNQYIERFHSAYAQTNLLIANNVATRITAQQQKDKKTQLSEQDRQIVTQAVQAAINEAKATVALNSQKSTNWEILATIYRNVLSVVQGADVWTISAYQRAIILDPQNPLYRLNLGGVYYSINNFGEALKMFEQTTALKPDWANAYYNLAWSAYQTADYPRSVREMQTVLTLLNPKTDQADYVRAQNDLNEFKKKLPPEEATVTPNSTPKQLSLPTPQPTLEPRVQLPKDASPSAK